MEIAHYIATIILILFVIKIIFSFIFWMREDGKKVEKGHRRRRHVQENYTLPPALEESFEDDNSDDDDFDNDNFDEN